MSEKAGKKVKGTSGSNPASPEDEKLFKQARWLLEHFTENIQKKHEQEDAMAHAPRYTRNDALYMIAGVKAVQYDGDHVQTSNLSNVPLKAALTVDDVLLRMNREVEKELSQGYEELCKDVALVNSAMMLMDEDVLCVAKQTYVKHLPDSEITAPDTHEYHYRTVKDLQREAVEAVMEVLKIEKRLRLAGCSIGTTTDNEEDWHD